MKKITIIITAIILALLTAAVMPAQVFADALPEYISEVKIGMGKEKEDAEAALKGYKILSDDKGNPVDLNDNAGGGWGSKGDKVVYLGYKTTTDKNEAITDLALMNMKGGYSVQEYDALLESNIKSQIIPLVDSFITTIKEYRENLAGGIALNRHRAQYVRLALNKFTDDDCGGAALGELLMNETKYEMGLKAYNALSAEEKEKTDILKESDKAYAKLSDAEKKKHADIVTILAQSNGESTIAIENLLVRASDTEEDSWIERISDMSYNSLVKAYAGMMSMLPTEAENELDRLYEDDAKRLLVKIKDFQDEIKSQDKAAETVEKLSNAEIEALTERIESFKSDSADMDDYIDLANAYTEYTSKQIKFVDSASTVAVCEYLKACEYGDGTLLDFFSRDFDDLTELYPVVAALSDGQRAGLDFVSLKDLVLMAEIDKDAFDKSALDKIDSESLYKGVDRAVFQKGGVALTSDALRKKAALKEEIPDSFTLGAGPAVLYVFAGVSLVGFVGSAVLKGITSKALRAASKQVTEEHKFIVSNFGRYINNETLQWEAELNNFTRPTKRAYDLLIPKSAQYKESERVLMGKSAFCNKILISFTVAMVLLTALATFLTYREMVAYYKVEFTPIPHYIIDEKDIYAYDAYGNKTVFKNQAAYYKAVETNRTADDELFGMLGTCADMNGDIGRQWLALYAEKNEDKAPILAKSLLVKVDDKDIPAGYTTGIHMFGSGSAFNLNSEIYDWNKDAPSVMVYYKTDSSSAGASGSNFTAGNLAIAGGAGLALGALISGIAAAAVGRKKSGKAAA